MKAMTVDKLMITFAPKPTVEHEIDNFPLYKNTKCIGEKIVREVMVKDRVFSIPS